MPAFNLDDNMAGGRVVDRSVTKEEVKQILHDLLSDKKQRFRVHPINHNSQQAIHSNKIFPTTDPGTNQRKTILDFMNIIFKNEGPKVDRIHAINYGEL